MARAPAMAGNTAAGVTDDPDATADTGGGADDTGDAGDDTGSTVLVTICQGADGGYIVYAGDESDDGGAGASADDDAAMGGGGGAAAGAAAGGAGGMGGGGAGGGMAGGQHVDSVGQALKAVMDILNESAASAGGPGSTEDQFQGGYNDDQSATPAPTRRGRGGMKYPSGAI